MADLATAIFLAAKLHINQMYGDGPYIFHPLRVMMKMKDEETRIIAVLHDVMEDCNATPELLKSFGFSARIINAIIVLTKTGNEEYQDYLKAVKRNKWALEVKLSDIRDNLDHMYQMEDGKKAERLLLKYGSALEYLESPDVE